MGSRASGAAPRGRQKVVATVLSSMGMVAAVLLGVWAIMARYDERVRDRIDAQGKETTEQLGQLRERMAKREGRFDDVQTDIRELRSLVIEAIKTDTADEADGEAAAN